MDKAERELTLLKSANADGDHHKSTNETLLRKIQLLEEELDAAEKNVKETVQKYVSSGSIPRISIISNWYIDCGRWMSRQNTLSVKFSVSSRSEINGKVSSR
jgi:Tropomyosin like